MNIPFVPKGENYTPSKWIHHSFFLSPTEWEELFSSIPGFLCFSLKNPQHESEILKDKKELFTAYREDVERFLHSKALIHSQKILPLALTRDPQDLGLQKVADGRVLVSIRRPLLLLRPHFFSLSQLDLSIAGGKRVFWGLQVSYPLVYIDPTSQEIQEGIQAPNGAIFTSFRKWIRKKTKYISLRIGEKRIACPYRISKEMIPLLKKNPSSLPEGVSVEEKSLAH